MSSANKKWQNNTCYGFGLNLRLLGTEFVTRDFVQNIIFFVRGQRFLEKKNVSVTQKNTRNNLRKN